MNEETLEHHGVKGMKWGVRKAAKKYKSSREKSKARKAKSKIEEDEMRKAAKAKIIERIDADGNFTRTVRPTATDSKKREKEWKKIYKNRGNLSDAEIQNTLKRLKWENELQKAANSASEEQRKAAQAKIDLAIKLIGAIPIQTDDGKTTNVKDWAAGALTGAIKDAAGKKVKHSDTLEHYGVKGMKWKLKGAAEQEPHEDKVGAGGSGLLDDQNEEEEEGETSTTPKKKWQPKDKTIDGHAPWVKAQPNPKSKIKKFEKMPIPKSKKLPTAGNGQDKKMDIRYLDQYKKHNKVPKL